MFDYGKLKAKSKNLDRIEVYTQIGSIMLSSMFDYGGLPDTVDTTHIELYDMFEGIACLTDIFNGEWISAHCKLAGSPDVNGFGKDAIVTTDNGKSKTITNWKTSDHIVVIPNNSIYAWDGQIRRFAYILGEVDKSIDCNVQYSRYAPVVRVSNDYEKKAMSTILTQIKDGVSQIFTSRKDLLTGGESDVLNLTDVKNSDKIQYLSHLHDDLLRRIYTMYGQPTLGTGKMAQQTEREISGSLTNSFIIPMDRLKCRKNALDRFNAITGSNATVDFSYCWKAQLKQLENDGKESAEDDESNRSIPEDESGTEE